MKSMGHKVSNELWGGMLASILSDRRALEIFLRRDTKMCKNGHFLAFSQIKWDFATASYIQGTTMWKLTSWPFRKCRTYWDLKFLNGSYWWSKSEDSEILASLAKISGVTKKRHGHNFQNRGLKRIAGVVNPIDYPCYSFQTSNLKIVAVSFFCYAAFPWIFFLKYNSTLTAIHKDLNHQSHHVLHIFWKLRPCSFTWPYPG